MIIMLDATPLVTRNISGVQQHARNIVSEWSRQRLLHKFVLLISRQAVDDPAYDLTFVKGLNPGFTVRFFRPSTRGWLKHEATRLPFLSGLSHGTGDVANVYHSFSPDISAFSELPAAPISHTIHDLACELDLNVRRSAQGHTERFNNRWSLRRAQHVVAVSTQTRNDTMNVYGVKPEDVHVIFNGINPIFHPESNPELARQLRRKIPVPNRYILLVGSDIPRRNYPRIFQAMAEIWREDPTLKLLLAGHNFWPNTPIYRQAQAAGVLDRMVFAESPTDTELAQLYREAVLTCCGSSFEGFGLSVLEAMACGCPVACSDMTSLREVAGKAVLFFAHDDPESIGRAVKSLTADAEYRRQLGRRGLIQAANFTWLAAAQNLLKILEQCAAATGGSPATSQQESP